MSVVSSACPYLRVQDAKAAIAFYQKVFGAEEVFRLTEPSGRVGHAELQLGASKLMLSDEYPENGIFAPQLGSNGTSIQVFVDDVDAIVEQAERAGAKLTMKPMNMFYGHRVAKFVDPYGHEWMVNCELERLSTDEVQRRFNALLNDPPADESPSTLTDA